MSSSPGPSPSAVVPVTPKFFRPPVNDQIIHVNGRSYRLGQQIGQGYFGAVYQCRDEWRNHLVAKILLPKGSYDDVRNQWQDEIKKLVALRHPNITCVYDAFEFQDTFYLILERCSSPLHDLICTPGIHGDTWLPYVAQPLLQAVDFMHRSGYVHKDIHPGNVYLNWVADPMVAAKPRVLQFKVGDLGLSRLETDIKVFNTMLAQWMLPPEAIDPIQFGQVGRQIDVYHVGLLLLSLLMGKIPGFTQDEIAAGLPRQTAETLKSPYAAPIAHALRRHVIQRPQSALDLWREINVIADALGVWKTSSLQ